MNLFINTRRSILVTLLATSLILGACGRQEDNGWQHLDLGEDNTFGISTERAYDEILKRKKSTPVIVAVVDAGFDVNHEGLAPMLWVNEGEHPENGIDDDRNGYVDDVHGWNFAGDADSTFRYDNTALARLVRQGRQRFAGNTMQTVATTDKHAFADYRMHQSQLQEKRGELQDQLVWEGKLMATLNSMVRKIGKENPVRQDFSAFQPTNELENQVRTILNRALKRKTYAEYYQEREYYIGQREALVKYGYNLDFRPNREIRLVNGDTLFWPGNADLRGSNPLHGTHVSGVIAAFNKKVFSQPSQGIQLMVARVSTGSAIRDEDIARAIRYAVDNGALVINMSFARENYSLNRNMVDDAVRYATDRDVLLVHAAGNDNYDLSEHVYYPKRDYANGGRSETWIKVGASGPYDDETLKASFSNYGKEEVDVFAPGVNIYSTIPNDKYRSFKGTSEAAPLVAGMAAVIRSYYPQLSAVQVRDIIIKSVTKSPRLTNLCVSGGVVNLYNALRMAEQYTKTSKQTTDE